SAANSRPQLPPARSSAAWQASSPRSWVWSVWHSRSPGDAPSPTTQTGRHVVSDEKGTGRPLGRGGLGGGHHAGEPVGGEVVRPQEQQRQTDDDPRHDGEAEQHAEFRRRRLLGGGTGGARLVPEQLQRQAEDARPERETKRLPGRPESD